MQAAARPYLAAGVALLGASAIAMSPVAPPMPNIAAPAVSSAQVNLSAATDPLQAYADLFASALANASTIIGTEVADPAPILLKVVTNQLVNAYNYGTALQAAGASLAKAFDPENEFGITAALQVAFQELLAGNVSVAVAKAWSGILTNGLGLLPLLTVMQGAAQAGVQNLANVLSNQYLVPQLVFGLAGPVYGVLGGVGTVGQNIVDAVKAGDPLGLANAVVTGPAVVGAGFNDTFLPATQLIHFVRGSIADLITPATPTPTALAAAPQAKAMVTLDVSPQVPTVAPAEAAPDETSSAAEDSAGADTTSTTTPRVMKDSAKRTNPAKQVREGIQGAVKNATDGLKKATHGLSGKSANAGKHAAGKHAAKSGGGSSEGASSSNAA